MSFANATGSTTGGSLEIIAFRLHEQQFCVRTTSIREIRGWLAPTPLPRSPTEIVGVMNLRGNVIPIIDVATKLGMMPSDPTPRSAIIVAEVGALVVGLVVDQVSDILTVSRDQIQPVPPISLTAGNEYSEGIINHDGGMICFLDLDRMFGDVAIASFEAAA